MRRHYLLLLVPAALLGTLFLGTGPAQAFGRGYGGYGGYGLSGGGYAGPMDYLARPGAPYGGGWGYGGNGQSGAFRYGAYSVPSYDYGWGLNSAGTAGTYNSFYPNLDRSTRPPNEAQIRLRVPANAEVWFDGQKTNQTGTVRNFYSPPLTPGQSYRYQVRVRWMQDGRPVEQERIVRVRANSIEDLNFGKPLPPMQGAHQ
jgi:uncharacterized protein (TIGR03000 family)